MHVLHILEHPERNKDAMGNILPNFLKVSKVPDHKKKLLKLKKSVYGTGGQGNISGADAGGAE